MGLHFGTLGSQPINLFFFRPQFLSNSLRRRRMLLSRVHPRSPHHSAFQARLKIDTTLLSYLFVVVFFFSSFAVTAFLFSSVSLSFFSLCCILSFWRAVLFFSLQLYFSSQLNYILRYYPVYFLVNKLRFFSVFIKAQDARVFQLRRRNWIEN